MSGRHRSEWLTLLNQMSARVDSMTGREVSESLNLLTKLPSFVSNEVGELPSLLINRLLYIMPEMDSHSLSLVSNSVLKLEIEKDEISNFFRQISIIKFNKIRDFALLVHSTAVNPDISFELKQELIEKWMRKISFTKNNMSIQDILQILICFNEMKISPPLFLLEIESQFVSLLSIISEAQVCSVMHAFSKLGIGFRMENEILILSTLTQLALTEKTILSLLRSINLIMSDSAESSATCQSLLNQLHRSTDLPPESLLKVIADLKFKFPLTVSPLIFSIPIKNHYSVARSLFQIDPQCEWSSLWTELFDCRSQNIRLTNILSRVDPDRVHFQNFDYTVLSETDRLVLLDTCSRINVACDSLISILLSQKFDQKNSVSLAKSVWRLTGHIPPELRGIDNEWILAKELDTSNILFPPSCHKEFPTIHPPFDPTETPGNFNEVREKLNQVDPFFLLQNEILFSWSKTNVPSPSEIAHAASKNAVVCLVPRRAIIDEQLAISIITCVSRN